MEAWIKEKGAATVCVPWLAVSLHQKSRARAAGKRPAHLGLHRAETRNVDADLLADVEVLVAFDSAAFFRKVGEAHGSARAVGAMHDGFDGDRESVLAADPSLHALHHTTPHTGAILTYVS